MSKLKSGGLYKDKEGTWVLLCRESATSDMLLRISFGGGDMFPFKKRAHVNDKGYELIANLWDIVREVKNSEM